MSFETLVIALGAITAAVWAPMVVSRVRTFHLLLFYLLAAACFGPLFLRVGGPVTIDRAVLVGLALVYAWRRTSGRIEPLRLGWLDYLSAALLAWLAVSVVAAGLQASGQLENPLGRLFHGYVLPLALFWIARNVFDPDRDAERLMRVMVVFGAYLAFTGVMEYLRVWALVFPTYIRDPLLGIHFGRARGPFLGAHSMGLWLTFCALAVYGLWPRLQPIGRLLAGGTMLAMSGAIVLTGTRSAWLGAAVAAVVVVAVTFQGWHRMAGLGAMGVAGVVVLLLFGKEAISPTRKGGTVEATESVHSRQALANISWRMFKDRPITGHGLGHYLRSSRDYFDVSDAPVPLSLARGVSQHSTFLSLLVETGIVGVGLFVLLLATWAGYGLHVWHCPGAGPMDRALACMWLAGLGSFVVQLASVEMAYESFGNCVIGFLAGCVAATRARLYGLGEPAACLNVGETYGSAHVRACSEMR